ncbi:MAG: GNAT family N-acetyltransferase [Christensenellaceae bacterium]
MHNTRIASQADIKEISALLAASWKKAYRGIVEDAYLDSIRDDAWVAFLTDEMHKSGAFVMVLENKRKMIGAAFLGKAQKEGKASLNAFYLLPEKIGKGLGRLFYCEIEAELKRRGFLGCVLDVLENNTRAIRFYRAHGFCETGEAIQTTLGEGTYTCRVMEKTLG